MAPTSPNPPPYPLYNTTFALHRVTPLYTNSSVPLNNASLALQARRFRDLLVGDVLRGVRVGLALEDDVLARVGALQSVSWRLLPSEENWLAEVDAWLGNVDNEDTAMDLNISRGILVTITYEKMVYTGILLRPAIHEDDGTQRGEAVAMNGFEHFPLLLTKMPGSLRDTFMDFLASTFDVRVSPLHLSSAYLTSTFEKYISDVTTDMDGSVLDLRESSRTLRSITKDVQIYLGFDLPGGSASLKTIDIQIAREDLPRLVAQGRNMRGQGRDAPFMKALASYIKAHLALDLKHEYVRIVRIACGAFVLGGEGRVKLPQPVGDGEDAHARATGKLLEALIEVAKGGWLAAGGVPP